jgi:RNA polymerase sigma factor for flagellar operon FliA
VKSRREAVHNRPRTKEELVLDNEEYVRRLVGQIAKRYRIPSDKVDEYVSAGYLGLVEAAERYSPGQGEFKSYAYLRIRGSVIDAIRQNCDLRRDMYKAAKVAAAINELAEADFVETGVGVELPGAEGEEKLANLLNFIAKGAIIHKLGSVDADEELSSLADDSQSAEDQLIEDEELSDLEKIVKRLPKEERKVIVDYYYKDRSFKEILDDKRYCANRSKSWLSKVHSRALNKLREKLERRKAKREQVGEEL